MLVVIFKDMSKFMGYLGWDHREGGANTLKKGE